MKSKNNNPVIEYLKFLDIHPARSSSRLISTLKDAAGEEWTNKILDLMNRRGDYGVNSLEEDESFYIAKNSNEAGSIALTGCIDGDIIRHFCEWIINHKNAFGKEILEVGCDVGIISCFIAKMFPDSSITAIDRCESSVNIAKKLAEKLQLTNIKFFAKDLKDITDTYDTVFSARTMHENFFNKDCNDFDFISNQGRIYKKSLEIYAEELTVPVNATGKLVTIERVERNPILLGWMLALNNQQFIWEDLYCENIRCQELRGELEESQFQAMIYIKDEALGESEVYDLFCNTFLDDMDLSAPMYDNWEAEIMFENSHGELIEGYEVFEPGMNNKQFALYSLWTSKYDKEGMLAYTNRIDLGMRNLENHYLSNKEDGLKAIRNLVQQHINANQLVKKLEYSNGKMYHGEVISQL